MSSRYFIKFIFLSFSILILQSCISKKQILYLQDVESFKNTEVPYKSNTIQVDDILKITIGAIMPEAVVPFNKLSGSSSVSNNIDIMKLDGYLVSQNLTINFPVLGELSVKDKTTQDLENDIKKINCLVVILVIYYLLADSIHLPAFPAIFKMRSNIDEIKIENRNRNRNKNKNRE